MFFRCSLRETDIGQMHHLISSRTCVLRRWLHGAIHAQHRILRRVSGSPILVTSYTGPDTMMQLQYLQTQFDFQNFHLQFRVKRTEAERYIESQPAREKLRAEVFQHLREKGIEIDLSGTYDGSSSSSNTKSN